MRIPEKDTTAVGDASQKIFQRRAAGKSVIVVEFDARLSISIARVVGSTVPEFAAEAEIMPAAHPRNVINELPRLVRRSEQWPPVISPQRIEVAESDLRHAKVERIGNTGVDFISR